MRVLAPRILIYYCLCAGLFCLRASAQKPELVVGTGHADVAYAIAFSPDGKILASGSGDDTIKLWEVASGRELRTFHGHTDVVNSVAFSPDGRILASGSNDDTIKLWDTMTGRELRAMTRHTSYVRSVVFSPDGRRLASASWDKTIKIWDVASGHELRTLSGHTSYVDSVFFNSDGSTLASGSSDGTVKTWDLASGRELGTLRVLTLAPGSIALLWFSFSPDGRTLGCSGSGSNTITLWDVASGRMLRDLTGYTEVMSFAFSPDGQTLASGSPNKEITLWGVNSGRKLRTLISNTVNVHTVSFSADGQMLASGSGLAEHGEDALTLWNVASGRELRTLTGHTGVISSVAFSPLKHMLASGSSDKTIKLWDLASGRELGTLIGHTGMVRSVAFSPDGRTLASGSDDKTIKLWDMTGHDLQTLTGHAGIVNCVAFSPDGRTLASASDFMPLEADSEESAAVGKVSAEVIGAELNVEKLKQQIAQMEVAGADTNDARRQLRGLEQSLATRRKVLASATAARESKIEIWDLTTGQQLRSLTAGESMSAPFSSTFTSVAFSRDGRTLASGSSNGTITLWDATSGTELRKLTGHKSSVYSVTFSPDQRTLASTSYDKTIKLWDLVTGRDLGTLTGHTASISSAVFSPDGLTLASGSYDGTIAFWNVAAQRELRTLTGPSIITSLDFSPDGRFLASGAADGSVRLLDSATAKLVASLYSLDQDEWAVSDPEGRFDSNNLDEIAGLSWVFPDEPLRALPPEIFMRDYYETKLLPKLLNRGKLREVGSLSRLNRAQPRVKVLNVQPDPEVGFVLVRVRVNSNYSEVQKDLAGNFLESGAFDLRLFRDGQLVAQWPEVPKAAERSLMTTGSQAELESWRKLYEIKLINGQYTQTFHHIRVPRRAGVDKVKYTAYAFNSDRVKSLTIPPYEYEIPKPVQGNVATRTAYLITMGVNANQSHNLDLELAVSSAERVRALLRGKLRGAYSEVVEVPLYSDLDANSNQVRLKTASKADLKAVLNLLADRPVNPSLRDEVDPKHQLRAAGPDDAVVLYVASHGYADPQGTFYLMPYDTGANWGITEDVLTRCQTNPEQSTTCRQAQDLLAHSVSSADLAAWWGGVDAGELVMILDSCHSGAVPGKEFRPGPLGDPGFGQLSYDKGMVILSASQPAQTEQGGWVSGGEGRTLLVDALEDIAKGNPQQTLEQWLQGTEQQLPQVAKQLYPALKEDDVQIPLLLDFAQKMKSIVAR
jgi:WD40 repeat protein